jgi:hypothetical protein
MGGGHLPNPTTSTSIGPSRRSTTSSTSTTTSTLDTLVTSTSTTLPFIPCQNDFQCDGLSTVCAVPFCDDDEACSRICVCVRPDRERTCELAEATPCLTPADCPRPIGDGCRLCYLNRCVTAPAPGCF